MSKKPLVLITGATGHLGFRTLVIALQHGYRVRIALRRLEQAGKIKATASIQPYLNDIEFVQVPDITADNAYDEAIKGVEFALHIASPIYSGLDPKDHDWNKLLYDPAKKGTLSMLNSAAKEPTVKRVVITSSVAAVELKDGKDRVGPYDLKKLPDQETLNNLEVAAAAYGVSKVMAHEAGTKFMEERKPSFDLVRVLPGYIQGANELYTSAAEMRKAEVLGSNEGTMNTALGNIQGSPRLTHQVFLDDVAKAHVLALQESVAKSGDNLLVAANGGTSIDWREFVPIIKKQFPEAVAKGWLDPKVEDGTVDQNYDVSSSEKALGFKFAGAEEMVKSLVGQYVSLLEREQQTA